MATKIYFSIFLLVWHVVATGYFGWNLTAQSAEEIIVDGLFIIGLSIIWVKQ